MLVREVRPQEYEALARLTVDAYQPHGIVSAEYEAELADVAGRAAAATVLVALDDDDDRLLGCITYVPPGPNPLAEHDELDVASIRMLAVGEHARRRGVGMALTEATLARARADGAAGVILHSVPSMTAAHRLYEGVGFVRDTALDWCPEPDVECLGYRLTF